MTVLLVGPVPPPYGGMALQMQQLARLLGQDGVEVDVFPSNFPLPRALRALERVPGARTIARACLIWFLLWRRMRRAQVVHVFAASWLYFFLTVYPVVLVGRLRRRRVVVNYRGGEAAAFFARVGVLAAPLFRLATVVTAPSEFIATVIRDRFGVPVRIVSNILDTSLFTYRARPTLRPRLLVTRHLERIYDVESVVKAFRAVQTVYPEASLWIAGGGRLEFELRRQVAEWNLRHVMFLGEIAHRDLPAVYDQCDVYVNGSLVDNFPGALVEAAAAGLAVVSTRAGGIPYMFEHERSALLVAPGDWQALGDGVVRVLRDQALARRLTQGALEMVRSCEWPSVRTQLFAAYGQPIPAEPAAAITGARCAAG